MHRPPPTRGTCGSSLRRGNPDRTAHARAAEAAIAHGILRQILLVIVLGKRELRPLEDFGGDRVKAPCLELLVVRRFRRLRSPALLGGECVDSGAILGAHVRALALALGTLSGLTGG